MITENCKISIVIVNYNVEYFLEQCLNSVYTALKNIEGEVFVVDNNSIDGSVEMVREKFPQANLIANKENLGFSKANNQAMRQAKGKYILLLNPDTVVEEDTFQKCLAFMDKTPDAGGLGVRMIDGKGNFLPESKRGLPTPAVAFYKIFGISRIFPKSKRFGKYHLGYLNEFETNECEILSGAFMLMRKEALDKVGLLDETFFMYGEDIDLSYRIIQGGYKNFYFPETQIIHYKGESTKKSSINYVFVFYRAMVIFAEKHFSQKNAKLFSFLINLAIYFRASLALASRFIKKAILPVVDFSVIILLLYAAKLLWQKEQIEFPVEVLRYALPSYTLVWMLSIFYSGGYDRPIKLFSYILGGGIGTAFILMIYALLPKDLQFSRLYILLGFLLVSSYFLLSRIVLHYLFKGKFDLKGVKNKTFGIVGSENEAERVEEILENSTNQVERIFRVSPSSEKEQGTIGSIDQLDQIVHIYKIDELIFCAKDSSAERIIYWMSQIASDDLEFKIAQPNSLYLIGSNSVDTAGDVYLLEIDKISETGQKRNKRTFDVITSLLFLIFSPLVSWFVEKPTVFIKNLVAIFIGQKSFVGYIPEEEIKPSKLPKIREGVLHPSDISQNQNMPLETKYKLNLLYARDYTVWKDVQLVFSKWKELGR